jgi:hypothetical protein
LSEGGGGECDEAEGEEKRRAAVFLVHGIFLATRARTGQAESRSLRCK